MKKHILNLFLCFMLFAGVACNGNTHDAEEEGEIPVSAEDPKAPTVAPDKPTTDIGAGLEDSLQEREAEADTL